MTELRNKLPGSGDFLLHPGKVLLPDGPRSGMGVVVRDGRFTDIGAAGLVGSRNPDLTPIELPHHLVMPGFIDTHTHLTQSLGKSLVFGEPSEIFRRIWVPLEGSLDERMVYLSAKLAALECLRGGFTAAVDAGTRSAGHINALIRAARQTGLRSVIGLICNDLGGAAVVPERATILKMRPGTWPHSRATLSFMPRSPFPFRRRPATICWPTFPGWHVRRERYSRPMSTNTSSPSSARWSQTAAARWSISPISAPSARMC